MVYRGILPDLFDYTDGAGHGMLIATDQIFVLLQSANTTQQNTAECRILYRWKNIGLQEYVGIVQSQQ